MHKLEFNKGLSMKLMICLVLAIFQLSLPVFAQPTEKIAPEIQILIEKIQSGDPILKKIMEMPGDGKVFPYRYFVSGIPKELKGKGIDDAFKWDANRKVNKELSGEGFRLFEDGTICLPVTFAVTRRFTDMLSQEVNPKIQENRILEREAFIKKYEVSWVSSHGSSIAIILPVKNLPAAIRDSLIQKAGNHLGFFIPGERINERDVATGFNNNYIVRRRILSNEDIESAFTFDPKYSNSKSKETYLDRELIYLNEIHVTLLSGTSQHQLDQLLKKEAIYEYNILKIRRNYFIRLSEREDVFLLMAKLRKYRGVYLKTVDINFQGTGDALNPGLTNYY